MIPRLDGTTIIIPMNAFAFHERMTGHIRCCAGWVPGCTQVVALDRHGRKLAIPLPVVSVLDTISSYENTRANRNKIWTRLLYDELPNEMHRARQLFERDKPEELSGLIDIALDFGLLDHAYMVVVDGESVPPPEVLGSCDLSERCLGALAMLALERTAG